MKTFKQYISESGVWDQGTGGGILTPWLPYPNSGGKNVVTPGSIKPPKRPTLDKIPRWKVFRDDQTGKLIQPEEIWGKSRFPYTGTEDPSPPTP
jgi:hypothetical protein